jgi:RNA polymerase sigma-70 factor (ECF subfamily)
VDAARHAELLALARAAWPGVEVPAEIFAAYLEERAAAGEPAAADLYLACACARGDRRAHEAFDRTLLSQLPQLLARFEGAPIDEIAAELRESLLFGKAGAAPRVVLYDGRGSLKGWLRVVALRAALRKRRNKPQTAEPVDAAEALLASGNPEIDLLKLRARADVERAFKESVVALPERERLLLALHYSDGLSLERLAAMYGQHRATIARQMARARRTLLESARSLLRERLRLTESECDSLVQLVRSQLRVGLRTVETPP